MIEIGQAVETDAGILYIEEYLGRGKSGYSYRASQNGQSVVYKHMHHEPCPYYHFADNKVALEVSAYHTLNKLAMPIPELLTYDEERDFLVKSFIAGKNAAECISERCLDEAIIETLFVLARRLQNAGLNIDYFPTNFVISGQHLFYIDYEVNKYRKAWDLKNWGIYYWANSDGFQSFLETGDHRAINKDNDSGLPIKEPFESTIKKWIACYA